MAQALKQGSGGSDSLFFGAEAIPEFWPALLPLPLSQAELAQFASVHHK